MGTENSYSLGRGGEGKEIKKNHARLVMLAWDVSHCIAPCGNCAWGGREGPRGLTPPRAGGGSLVLCSRKP